MVRLITSLNWVVGFLALILAVGYPFFNSVVMQTTAEYSGKNLVKEVLKGQRGQYNTHEKYVYYSPDKSTIEAFSSKLGLMSVPQATSDFDIYSFRTDDKILIVRAVLNKQKVSEGWLPPMLYEHVIEKPGTAGEGKWVKLSNKTLALF